MTPKRLVRCALDGVVSGVARGSGVRALPTFFNGIWLRLHRPSWQSVYDRYEPYMARVLRDELRAGGTFLDVGAHYGLWSLYAASLVGARGCVVSLEPSEAFDVLKANASGYPRVNALRMGAGSQDGEATFFGQGTSKGGSFVDQVTRINQHYEHEVPVTSYRVPIRSLDSLVRELDLRPTLVKIDVEGFELEVLTGAKGLLQETRPTLAVEIHPPQLEMSGGSDRAVLAALEQLGYAIEIVDRNPNSLYTIRARALAAVHPRAAVG